MRGSELAGRSTVAAGATRSLGEFRRELLFGTIGVDDGDGVHPAVDSCGYSRVLFDEMDVEAAAAKGIAPLTIGADGRPDQSSGFSLVAARSPDSLIDCSVGVRSLPRLSHKHNKVPVPPPVMA